MDYKEQLKQQMNDSKSNKKEFSGKRVLNFQDENVQFYKPKEGMNKIDIIPYIVATDNHPHNKEKNNLSYVLDVYVHSYIGINKSSFVCMQKTYGKRCPICEEQRMYRDQNQKELADKLNSSRKVFYNIIDTDNRDAGIQIFATSHFLFEKELTEEAFVGADADGNGIILFADIEDGRTISFRARETTKTFGSGKPTTYLEYKNFSFHKRDTDYDERILKKAYSLDNYLYIPTYDEAKNELLGIEDEDNKEDKKKEGWINDKEDKGIIKCPEGFNFGADWDEHDECDECNLWKDCKKANK